MTYPTMSVLIFSKNRPMQLLALLESMFANSNIDPRNCFVLYKADEPYFVPYMEVFSYFPDVNIWPEWDFKAQVKDFVFNACPNVCFFTDDDVFKRKINVGECILALNDDKNAMAFSLRLGRHLNFCYSTQSPQKLPGNFILHHGNILSWLYKGTDWDWNYPLSVDGHIFKREDLLNAMSMIPDSWTSPNTFEGYLSHLHPVLKKTTMYCFEESVVFNIPHNKVQKEVNNVFAGGSEEDLLKLWEDNKKIDISTFQGIKNVSAHQIVPLTFIQR